MVEKREQKTQDSTEIVNEVKEKNVSPEGRVKNAISAERQEADKEAPETKTWIESGKEALGGVVGASSTLVGGIFKALKVAAFLLLYAAGKVIKKVVIEPVWGYAKKKLDIKEAKKDSGK